MEVTRRGFLGLSAGAALGAVAAGTGAMPVAAGAPAGTGPQGSATTTICPFCAVGCGALVTTKVGPGGRRTVTHVEGDPDHPINEGTLCPKGAAIAQMANGERRLTRPLYRAKGASGFEEKDWDWTVREIARRVKDTRDRTFEVTDREGREVRRTLAIASVGSAALDNEECWTYQAVLRAIGVPWIEHQARV